MNIRLLAVKIKWFIKKYYWEIKKYLWCSYIHEKKDRCYPRDPNGYWHCEKCKPCNTCFDYIDDILIAKGLLKREDIPKNDKTI